MCLFFQSTAYFKGLAKAVGNGRRKEHNFRFFPPQASPQSSQKRQPSHFTALATTIKISHSLLLYPCIKTSSSFSNCGTSSQEFYLFVEVFVSTSNLLQQKVCPCHLVIQPVADKQLRPPGTCGCPQGKFLYQYAFYHTSLESTSCHLFDF